ncbi:MAG: WD40 repeat domain-containing protein [Planctomycetota bacterium]
MRLSPMPQVCAVFLAVALLNSLPFSSTTATADESKSEPANADFKLVAALDKHDEIVMTLDFHPKLSLLATASRDGQVRIWDTKK